MSAIVDFPVKPEARPYLEAFGHERHTGDPEWLLGYRKRSLARFAELGFPSRRSEAWRYLDLRALEQKPMLPSEAPSTIDSGSLRERLTAIGFAGAAHRVVLVDGRLAPGLSFIKGLPAGVWLGSIAEAFDQRPDLVRSRFESPSVDPARPFAALNAAFFADGFVLDVAPGVSVDQPIEIVHLSSGQADASFHTRSFLSVGVGGRVSVLENFAGDGDYWRNDVVELRLAASADLTRMTVIEEAAEALHFGETVATLAGASRLSDFALLLGGRTVRRETTVRSEAEGTRSELNGAFLLSGRQEANILTTVDHAAPGGETREIFTGVATDRAHGAFQGRITVRPGAQKVDAHQMSRNLVLGPRAAIDTKPELEIFADDVKCSHGATVGDLDEAALFYLRARGIPNNEARRLLVEGFLREPLEDIADPVIREHLLRRLSLRLARLEDA
jgi:Fe-S cluster assembly protein SufD